ncbi:unnamed protein product [Prorocentrum cordatum]|uniref:Uncharacterized protein n=1 Tax=Prorocentrum cordatum TaxID=2364126 RepID=A0ABN9UGP9_9DINO|nr:unnamed protein product [Polarella glacialis]
MRASVILYSIAASSLIEANALRQRAGGSHAAKIAGIVPTHKTTFKFFKQFARDWEACPEGREAMDLMPVFSTEEDHEQFNMKLKTQFPDFKFDDPVACGKSRQRDCPASSKPASRINDDSDADDGEAQDNGDKDEDEEVEVRRHM